MTTLVDILIERKKRNQRYFLEYREYASKIKGITRILLKDEDARVLVFGSVVKGTWIPNKSDIDVLIISESVLKSATWQSDLKVRILEEMGVDLTAPFEFHFATQEIYTSWYQKFIHDEYVEI